MRARCIELLHFITEAIDNDAPDCTINKRFEAVANCDEITNAEYIKIYTLAMQAYKAKFNLSNE